MASQAKVFIGICTGPSKDYAMHQMVASLRNLDWENVETHWAITHFMNAESDKYVQRLKALLGTVEWKGSVHIHLTYFDERKPVRYARIDNEEGEKVLKCYDLVLNNLRLLRGVFLDGDCEYFLEVGGDNPPPRNTIKRLMALNCDVAFGTCYQRPGRDGKGHEGAPLVFAYSWMPEELERFNLEPELKRQFHLAFTNTPFLINVAMARNWRKLRCMRDFAGGTGMVLIKRHVLERVGWRLPPSKYFSEDVYFCLQCHAHDYSMVQDMKFHIPHLHDDGWGY